MPSGAPQCGESSVVSRRRRLDGLARSAAEQLFSAAKSQFKRLEHFCFHNCLYGAVWKNSRRRDEERVATRSPEFLRAGPTRYLRRRRVDASYETPSPGGSVETSQSRASKLRLERAVLNRPRTVWMNPSPPGHWRHSQSTTMIAEVFQHRTFPLTPDGVAAAMQALAA